MMLSEAGIKAALKSAPQLEKKNIELKDGGERGIFEPPRTYVFPHRLDGHIWVRLARPDENTARISVRDDGVGLPTGFDMNQCRGMGMRIVAKLSKQLGVAITHRGHFDGTEFVLMVPLRPVTA